MDDHYLFLNSQNSRNLYPYNEACDFTVEQLRPYILEGQWECGLKEINIPLKEETMTICSNLCQESYIENTMLPVLRIVHKKKKESYCLLNDPFYVVMKTHNVNKLRIFIRGRNIKSLSDKQSSVQCTLHLRRKWK